MNERTGRNALTIASAVALALAAAAAAAETAAPLGEVFVTAQKRAESLADIPMSVSVLPGDALERQQATSFEDLASLIPGLSFNSSTPGVTRIAMRGINTGGVASTITRGSSIASGSSAGRSSRSGAASGVALGRSQGAGSPDSLAASVASASVTISRIAIGSETGSGSRSGARPS